MARNKYPEETLNLILDVSLKLFLEKGYEDTTIQDIIDNLGGLTKGAIYHHFKSKEDIMLAVIKRMDGSQDAERLQLLLNDKKSSGLEKLREIFRLSLNSPNQIEIAGSAPNMLNNPKILTTMLDCIVNESTPLYIQPIIEQGIQDGSIRTEYPKELGEVVLLLVNLWLTPMVFYDEINVMRRRFKFFQQMMIGLGVDIFDEPMFEKFEELCLIYSRKR